MGHGPTCAFRKVHKYIHTTRTELRSNAIANQGSGQSVYFAVTNSIALPLRETIGRSILQADFSPAVPPFLSEPSEK